MILKWGIIVLFQISVTKNLSLSLFGETCGVSFWLLALSTLGGAGRGKVIQLVYQDQKEQRVINFIILIFHIFRLVTDIMTPEGAMLPSYSKHCSYFSLSLGRKAWKRLMLSMYFCGKSNPQVVKLSTFL